MSEYKFSMPWPPTVNQWHQPIKMGKAVRITKSQKARAYLKLALEHIEQNLGLYGENIEQRLSVKLVLHPPSLRKYDIDNRTKGIFDALSEAKFWIDDEQVERLLLEKGQKEAGGRVEVEVSFI